MALLLSVPVAATANGWGHPDRSNDVKNASKDGRARNVILLIGDCMGDSEITIARNYYVGADGRLAMDTLPLTGEMTTFSVEESDPSLVDYVLDSASTGTAWATGVKTSDGRISTTAATDEDLRTILEMAQRMGMKVGNVSTAEIVDATPAVLASHVSDRGCKGPETMTACPQDKKLNGGPGSIAEQLVDHGVDVLLGGARSSFEQVIDGGPDAGKSVIESAEAMGYTVVFDEARMDAVEPGEKVLGLFADGNMSIDWSGAPAMPYPGSGPQTCTQGNRAEGEPTLAEMTTKAIELLENDDHGHSFWPWKKKSDKGFFLQVEGASIDKRDHAAEPCQQIGETVQFDEAVKVALDYAKEHPDTLVIVTADHGHTSQIIEQPTSPDQPGAFSQLITNEGAVMTVSYATAPVGASQSHTGTEIRVAAKGPQAANVVGIIDQTELFEIMARALGLQ